MFFFQFEIIINVYLLTPSFERPSVKQLSPSIQLVFYHAQMTSKQHKGNPSRSTCVNFFIYT